jgi:hypothetical protein
MPQETLDLLHRAIDANNADKFRRGNVIYLPGSTVLTTGGGTSLIATGDLHGHWRNFERIVSFADLASNPDRHVVLQEIIHGGPVDGERGCLSYQLLFEAARYKLNFPDRVHIIMGNHDTAFINGSKVIKDGKEMNRSMREALCREFEGNVAEVEQAIKEFLLSEPLAVRTENRIWLSHSLPADHFLDKFDVEVLQRPLEVGDTVKPGSAYLLTWGRKMSQETLDRMAELLNVDLFVLGHQPQEQGWTQAGRNLVIIASDHSHGCLLPVDVSRAYTIEGLIESIVPLASIP